MNHFTVLTTDVERTLEFYELLGLSRGFRPQLSTQGAWMYLSGQAVLHLIHYSKVPDPPGGVLDHMAFSAVDLRGTATRLTEAKIGYGLKKQWHTGTWQLFVYDPNGALVELDFEPGETPPEQPPASGA